ncbi:MAG: hypothetical protein CVV41_13675 [Candidatus Riflebacteria bacterium HGW-Riflebacteria-1]|jgi:hypothetical protein|nr:MAG: hypothetical protein CVV41_13675 [Candidatus Riflebacteria bacterium HGW-Riflebacteria-1]
MNKFHFKYLLIAALIAVATLTGCGGGGGGGGVFDPGAVTLTIPTSNQLTVPAAFSSVDGAFPTIGPNVELELANFTNTSEALMVFVNMTGQTQQLTWGAEELPTAASRRGAIIAGRREIDKQGVRSPEHAFHLMLRQQSQRQRRLGPASQQPLRASARSAVAVNDTQSFNLYVSDTQNKPVSAICKHTELLAGTDKKFHIFVDNSVNMAQVAGIVGDIANNWTKIYKKNRDIFGEEPTGVLDNGVDATDFYIVISPQVFTAGYFYTGDLNLTSATSDSNQKKIFFLKLESIASVDDKARAVNVLSATMAHEFQHMIHFWQRGSNSDIWLEEAMSGYAEYINDYKIENGINQSKALQAKLYFDQVSDVQLDAWHLSNDHPDTVNAHYGKVFLFGIWLAQNYGSSGSVVSLLKNKTSDIAAIEAFTGKNFGELYAKFMLALIVNNPAADNGGYGINGLDLAGTYPFINGLESVKLTGPAVANVAATTDSSSSPTIAPRAAVYVRVTGGKGNGLWLTATLPAGTALFQLRK